MPHHTVVTHLGVAIAPTVFAGHLLAMCLLNRLKVLFAVIGTSISSSRVLFCDWLVAGMTVVVSKLCGVFSRVHNGVLAFEDEHNMYSAMVGFALAGRTLVVAYFYTTGA
jgi:hypothetical protein